MNTLLEQAPSKSGLALIFGGPHGAGKDTIAAKFAETVPGVERIVRHITRAPAENEQEGQDYFFVNEATFDQMAGDGEFIEHAAFPGVKSGTTLREIREKTVRACFSTLTANFEDGLNLHKNLRTVGIASICLFVSPCSEQEMTDNPSKYLSLLRARMNNRARGSDHIEGRLQMATRYRELYLANAAEVNYIENQDGQLSRALQQVAQAVLRQF